MSRGPGSRPTLSIVVPVLNEATAIGHTLGALRTWRAAGDEVLVVDGGSADETVACASALASRVLVAPRGRARQMNAGAALARGACLVFLHADTVPAPDCRDALLAALADPRHRWGRFDVRLSGRHPAFRVIETLMNTRSRVTGIATGDQAIFVERALFDAVGGFPDIALMEDVALSRALKRVARPVALHARVVTSSRRWETRGIVRTVLLMWSLRAAYALGADPDRLARWYRR